MFFVEEKNINQPETVCRRIGHRKNVIFYRRTNILVELEIFKTFIKILLYVTIRTAHRTLAEDQIVQKFFKLLFQTQGRN